MRAQKRKTGLREKARLPVQPAKFHILMSWRSRRTRLSSFSLVILVPKLSFPNSVWERRTAKLRFAGRTTRRGKQVAGASPKRSFGIARSQTEFGNEEN